jgi:porphobilinogen deaminase
MQGNGNGNQTIQGLVGEALRESTDLAQKEFTLFRTEVSQNIRTLFMGLAMVVVAAIFAIAAVMLLTESLVEWLATVVNSEARRWCACADRHRSRALGTQCHDLVLAHAATDDALPQA